MSRLSRMLGLFMLVVAGVTLPASSAVADAVWYPRGASRGGVSVAGHPASSSGVETWLVLLIAVCAAVIGAFLAETVRSATRHYRSRRLAPA